MPVNLQRRLIMVKTCRALHLDLAVNTEQYTVDMLKRVTLRLIEKDGSLSRRQVGIKLGLEMPAFPKSKLRL